MWDKCLPEYIKISNQIVHKYNCSMLLLQFHNGRRELPSLVQSVELYYSGIIFCNSYGISSTHIKHGHQRVCDTILLCYNACRDWQNRGILKNWPNSKTLDHLLLISWFQHEQKQVLLHLHLLKYFHLSSICSSVYYVPLSHQNLKTKFIAHLLYMLSTCQIAQSKATGESTMESHKALRNWRFSLMNKVWESWDCSSSRRLRGASTICLNPWRECAEKTEPDSFLRPEVMDTGGTLWTSGQTWWLTTGTDIFPLT